MSGSYNRKTDAPIRILNAFAHFEVLRFDDFELNIQSGELRKHGKTLRLQPQPAKVLSLLALQPGKLVRLILKPNKKSSLRRRWYPFRCIRQLSGTGTEGGLW
jgi:hypothetical protein